VLVFLLDGSGSRSIPMPINLDNETEPWVRLASAATFTSQLWSLNVAP